MHEKRSISVHDQQVDIARKATANAIDDLIGKLISFASNITENKTRIAATVCSGIDQYNNALLTSIDRIGTKPLNFNSATFSLDDLDIEELEGISNTQRLLLHQVRINNIIKNKIKNLTESASVSNILDLVKGLVTLDDYSNYMAKFPGIDPESFRKFQLLNHYAYLNFSSLLYEETIYKIPEHSKTTINQYIQQFIDDIHAFPTDFILKENDHSSNYQDELIKNFWMAIKNVAKSSTTEHADVIEKIRAIVPSLLQIRNTEDNERQLKICINELLDIEKTSTDFSLTIDFFNSYFDVCYKEHASDTPDLRAKIQQEKTAVKQKITDYIQYVRSINKKETELPQIKAGIRELAVIKSQITQLQIRELLSTSLISESINEDLKKILSRVAEIGFDVLTERLSDYSDFIKNNKAKLTQFKEEYHIEGNIDLLVNYIEEQLNAQTMTPRAKYYDGLLKTIEKKLGQHYLEINQYINAKIDHAEVIAHYPDNSDSEIIAADKLSVIPSNVYNPLINKINYHMPRDIADKFKILNSIEQEIISVNSELAKLEYLITPVNSSPDAIQTGMKRLSQIKDKLTAKHHSFETNLFYFSVGKIELLLQEQTEYALKQNRELLNNLLPISLENKEKLDQNVLAKTSKLTEKLTQLQAFLSKSQNYSGELLAQQLSDVKILIAQLELEQLAGKKTFNFTQIKHDLESLTRYYTDGSENKLSGIERRNPSITPIPYSHGETTPKIITSALSFTRFASVIYSIYNWVANGVNILSKYFGQLYRSVARLSSNNKALLNRMDKLAQEISSSDCNNKSQLSAEIASTRDKIGRFNTKFSDIVEQYDALNSKFIKALNQSVIELKTEPAPFKDIPPVTNPIDTIKISPPVTISLENSTSTLNEYTELLQNLIANPGAATNLAKQACYAATKDPSLKWIEIKTEELDKKITSELSELHKSLNALLSDANNPQIKVIASQIRTLEKIQLELGAVKQEYAEVKKSTLWEEVTDELIQRFDTVNRHIENLDHQVNVYFDTATSAQTVLQCLKNFTQARTTSKEAAMFALLKKAVIEVSKKEQFTATTGAEIANAALMAVLNNVPSIAASFTDTWGTAHDIVACKNIINASFNGIVEQLKKSTDIKDLEKACKKAASIALTKEISQLATILVGQSQNTEDNRFREKIKKLSESTSDYLLQLYAANQGLQLMLFLVEHEPKMRDLLGNVFIRARDSITDALSQEKSSEEIIAAANKVVYEEVKKALGDQYTPTSTAKKIQNPDLPKLELEEKLRSSIMQLTKDLVQLEKRLNEPQDKTEQDSASVIQFKITEKSKSLAQLNEIQAKLVIFSADEANLNCIAKSYPFGEVQFKIIYQEEKYAPMTQRKFELENAFEDLVSPGLMAQVYTIVNDVCHTISEPTQDAAASTLRDIINTTVDSLKQNDSPADIAFKVIDVTLQGLLTVLNTVNFGSSTNDRKEILQNLIKTAIVEAVRANHEHTSPNIDPMLLSKQALIKVLEELQNPKLFEKITVNWWKNTQLELFKIGSDAVILKLQENKSTLSEAAEMFCSATYNHVNSLWLPNPFQIAVKMLLKPNLPQTVSQPELPQTPTPAKEKSITSDCELVEFKGKSNR